MTKPFKTLDDMGDIHGKRVLVREDLNVPMAEGRVTDDTRLRATVATVGELADKGAIVLVLAHFGRPKGKPSPDFSLSQVVKPYSEVLGREVRYIDWEGAEDSVATLEPGDIAVVSAFGLEAGAIWTGERWAIRAGRGLHFLGTVGVRVVRAWRP